MSHPSGQLSNGLHFLRLAQLLFQLFALRNVFGQSGHATKLPLFISDGEPAFVNPPHGAIGPRDAVFLLIRFSAHRPFQPGQDSMAIGRMDRIRERRRPFIKTLAQGAFVSAVKPLSCNKE
jgi:hypothetical protein